MTNQQKSDYSATLALWRMFREFGDITNTEKDQPRWGELVDMADDMGRKMPEYKRLICSMIRFLEDRAKASTQEDVA